MTYTLFLCIGVTWTGCGATLETPGYITLEDCVKVLEVSIKNPDTTGVCSPKIKKAQTSD